MRITNVNICGMPHEVRYISDVFDKNPIIGQIDYKACEITLYEGMSPGMMRETLTHEMLHGILEHLGYDELNENEQFVSAMANAISQGFAILPNSMEKEDTD